MATKTALVLSLWILFVSSSVISSIASASEISLVLPGLTTLQISPSLLVEKSPGAKPGTKLKCERVQIHGFPRIKHLNKIANSVKVQVSRVSTNSRPPKVEICFHRNVSLGIGMCPQDQWERLSDKSWVKSMSPFDHKLLDIRVAESYSESLQVSLDEEFFWYRVLFLILGLVMMPLASWLSNSLAFYFSWAMVLGVFLVILMVLFQGMKLLPTGRKSSLAIFLYSCFVGFGSFLLHYVPSLFKSLLLDLGLSEDMYNPVAIFLLVLLAITGAWLGFFVVRKAVLTKDGSIDSGVAHLMTWSIRIIASVMILQSSSDPLMAAEALMCGIFVSLLVNKFGRLIKIIRRVYRKLSRLKKMNRVKSPEPRASPFTRSPYTPVRGSTSKSPTTRLSDSKTFYSTFHETPDRRKFSKSEWDEFTEESTRKALKGLVSSPDFGNWFVKNADRITVAPSEEISEEISE